MSAPRQTTLSSLPTELQTRIAFFVRGESPEFDVSYSRTDLLKLGTVNKPWNDITKPLLSEFMIETLYNSLVAAVPTSALAYVKTAVVGLTVSESMLQDMLDEPKDDQKALASTLYHMDVGSARCVRQCTSLRAVEIYSGVNDEEDGDGFEVLPYTLHALLACQNLTRLSAMAVHNRQEIDIVAQLVEGLPLLRALRIDAKADIVYMQAVWGRKDGEVPIEDDQEILDGHIARLHLTENICRAGNLVFLELGGACLAEESHAHQFGSKLKVLVSGASNTAKTVRHMFNHSASTLEMATIDTKVLIGALGSSDNLPELPELQTLAISSYDRGDLKDINVEELARANKLHTLNILAENDAINLACRIIKASVYPHLRNLHIKQLEGSQKLQGLDVLCQEQGISLVVGSFDDILDELDLEVAPNDE